MMQQEETCVVCWNDKTEKKTGCCKQRLCGTCYDKIDCCPMCRAKNAFKIKVIKVKLTRQQRDNIEVEIRCRRRSTEVLRDINPTAVLRHERQILQLELMLKVQCPCGSVVSHSSVARHNQSQKHQRFVVVR